MERGGKEEKGMKTRITRKRKEAGGEVGKQIKGGERDELTI